MAAKNSKMAAILMIFDKSTHYFFMFLVLIFHYNMQFGRFWCQNVPNDIPPHLIVGQLDPRFGRQVYPTR